MPYTNEEIFNAAQILRSFSNHHVHSNWNYTRDHKIKNIQFTSDATGLDACKDKLKRLKQNIPRAVSTSKNILRRELKPNSLDALMYSEDINKSLFDRIKHAGIIMYVNAKISVRRETHVPDGVLDRGNIMVFWEETGEYLQLMQPPMANIICDLMESEPQHPMSQKFYETLLEYAPSYIEKNTNSEEKFVDLSSEEHPHLHAYLSQYDFGNYAYISYPKLHEHLRLENGKAPLEEIKRIIAES